MKPTDKGMDKEQGNRAVSSDNETAIRRIVRDELMEASLNANEKLSDFLLNPESPPDRQDRSAAPCIR
jgi:hypothetical protein